MAFSINLRNMSRSNHLVIRSFQSTITRYTSTTSNYLTYGKIQSFSSQKRLKNVFVFTDKDPAKSFFDRENQKLLKSITRLQLDKIYRKRTVSKNEVEFK